MNDTKIYIVDVRDMTRTGLWLKGRTCTNLLCPCAGAYGTWPGWLLTLPLTARTDLYWSVRDMTRTGLWPVQDLQDGPVRGRTGHDLADYWLCP